MNAIITLLVCLLFFVFAFFGGTLFVYFLYRHAGGKKKFIKFIKSL